MKWGVLIEDCFVPGRWDVIKPLTLHYDLHPLSVEDLLYHGNASSLRSKAEYFHQHLFLSLVAHRTLTSTEDDQDYMNGTSTPTDGGTKAAERAHMAHQFGFHVTHPAQDEEQVIESRPTNASGSSLAASQTNFHPKSHATYAKALKRAFAKPSQMPEEAMELGEKNSVRMSFRLSVH